MYKENPEKVDGDDPKPMNPLVLWPVGCTSAQDEHDDRGILVRLVPDVILGHEKI